MCVCEKTEQFAINTIWFAEEIIQIKMGTHRIDTGKLLEKHQRDANNETLSIRSDWE